MATNQVLNLLRVRQEVMRKTLEQIAALPPRNDRLRRGLAESALLFIDLCLVPKELHGVNE